MRPPSRTKKLTGFVILGVCVACLILNAAGSLEASEARMNAPSAPLIRAPLENPPSVRSPVQSVLLGALRFFREHISPIDGARCSFHPTCAAYASEAIAIYGPSEGLLMTADRLMRCNPWKGIESHYLKMPNGRFYDPPVTSRCAKE